MKPIADCSYKKSLETRPSNVDKVAAINANLHRPWPISHGTDSVLAGNDEVY